MKKLILIAATLTIAAYASAQTTQRQITDALQAATAVTADADTTYWARKGVAGANISQASFSNWSAGGDPSIAFDLMFNYDMDYKRSKDLWTNRIELAYGLNNTQSNGMRKTNDKIYLASNYGYAIAKNLYLGAMLTFSTQFDKGYDYKITPNPDRNTDYISKLMAPGYLTAGLGVIWTPKSWLKVTYAPASWRGTFVLDDILSAAGAYGVEPGRKLLQQFGSDLVGEVNTPLWRNWSLYSRLQLYSNYLKNPQNIIIQWDTTLSMKVTRWLSANLNVNMIYDDNIKFLQENGKEIPRFQIKQVLGIGLQATF